VEARSSSMATHNGKWRVESGEWKVESGKWEVVSGEWKVESGEWKVESGKLRVESGKERVESEEWKDKTKGTIFSRPRAGPRVCLSAPIYDSKSIDFQKFFIYLGIHFDDNRWLKNSIDYTTVAARSAMLALIGPMKELGIMCLDTNFRLFKSLVLSIGNYKCHVWGPNLLMPSESCTLTKNPMQILILEFICLISGCGRITSR
jgi:hypothetical protein